MNQRGFSNRLLFHLYLTQALLLMIGGGILLFQGRLPWVLFGWDQGSAWLMGAGVGMAIVMVNVLLVWRFPRAWMDDGGINEALFQGRSLFHIAVISLVVAVAEEILFRGAIQHWLGVVGTSLLFTVIHFRYLHRGLMVAVLLLTSLGLGWLTEYFGFLAPAIVAHFTIDFLLGTFIRFGLVSRLSRERSPC